MRSCGTGDDPSAGFGVGGGSTFTTEMREMNYILRSATPKSLVLIDELCRATNEEEGAAVAWALSEALLVIGR